MVNQGKFDMMIGRMDRVLSETILTAGTALSPEMDEPNFQTLKHHAEDMIGAGMKALDLMGKSFPEHLIPQLRRLAFTVKRKPEKTPLPEGEKAKIIGVDNYNNENVSDVLVMDNVNTYWADKVAHFMNKESGEGSQYYYKVVPMDYKLYEWQA